MASKNATKWQNWILVLAYILRVRDFKHLESTKAETDLKQSGKQRKLETFIKQFSKQSYLKIQTRLYSGVVSGGSNGSTEPLNFMK